MALAADAWDLCIAKTSTDMVLTMQYKQVFIFDGKEFQPPVSSYCWEMIEMRYIFINQSNPVLLKERVHIPWTRRDGGTAMLWGALPLDGVGSCRLFFTDDLHDTLSWVLASDKPLTFKSYFTHSSQVFFGRPEPFLPGTGLDLTPFISPLECVTCPNHLSRHSRTRTARSHIPSFLTLNVRGPS